MIKLKDILLEDEKKKPSEDPDKMLVKSKESGQSYYISKDNFDPSKHEKPKSKTPSKDSTDSQKKDEKSTDTKDDSEKKPEDSGDDKTESPNGKLEKKLGSNVFVNDLEHKSIDRKSAGLRPDLKKKLIDYDFVNLFDDYNNLQFSGASESELKTISRKIQEIAIAKFSAIANRENDINVIQSAKFYRNNTPEINKVLRTDKKLMSKEELKKQLADKSMPKEFFNELKKIQAIYDMDEHFKTDGAKLENNITVYRSVKPSLIDDFVTAKEWVDNAFVSTSLNPIITEDNDNTERNPLLKIHLKRGDKVLILPCSEDEFCIETEVTLPRGCKFKIDDYNKINNSYDVSVEYSDA